MQKNIRAFLSSRLVSTKLTSIGPVLFASRKDNMQRPISSMHSGSIPSSGMLNSQEKCQWLHLIHPFARMVAEIICIPTGLKYN